MRITDNQVKREARVTLTIRVPEDLASAIDVLKDEQSLNAWLVEQLRTVVGRARSTLGKKARRLRRG